MGSWQVSDRQLRFVFVPEVQDEAVAEYPVAEDQDAHLLGLSSDQLFHPPFEVVP